MGQPHRGHIKFIFTQTRFTSPRWPTTSSRYARTNRKSPKIIKDAMLFRDNNSLQITWRRNVGYSYNCAIRRLIVDRDENFAWQNNYGSTQTRQRTVANRSKETREITCNFRKNRAVGGGRTVTVSYPRNRRHRRRRRWKLRQKLNWKNRLLAQSKNGQSKKRNASKYSQEFIHYLYFNWTVNAKSLKTRWLYCVEWRQYSIRHKAVRYMQ